MANGFSLDLKKYDQAETRSDVVLDPESGENVALAYAVRWKGFCDRSPKPRDTGRFPLVVQDRQIFDVLPSENDEVVDLENSQKFRKFRKFWIYFAVKISWVSRFMVHFVFVQPKCRNTWEMSQNQEPQKLSVIGERPYHKRDNMGKMNHQQNKTSPLQRGKQK